MSNVSYVAGSKEQIVVELTCSATGFDVTEWTGELAFTELGDAFDGAAATWVDAVLTAGATSDAFVAAVMQTIDVDLDPGKYKAHVRLTKTGDATAELPILPAQGFITITDSYVVAP